MSNAEVKCLKTDLEESRSTIVCLNDDLAATNENMVESYDIANSLSLELAALKTRHKSEATELQDLLHESKTTLKSCENVVTSKDAEIDNLRCNYEKVKLSLESRDDEYEHFRSSLATIEHREMKLTELTEQHTKYIKDLDRQEDLLREFKTKLRSSEDIVASKEAELDGLRCDSDTLGSALESRDDECQQLHALLADSESKTSSLEAELEEYVSQAEKERDVSDRKIAILVKELNDIETVVRSLHDTIHHLENEVPRKATNLGSHNNTDNTYAVLEEANEHIQADIEKEFKSQHCTVIKATPINSNAIGQLDAALSNSVASSKAIERDLIGKISELQNETNELRQKVQNRDGEMDQLRRELKLRELESMKKSDVAAFPGSNQRVNEESSGAVGEEVSSVNSVGAPVNLDSNDDSEAKEAVRELLMELNLAVTEKDQAHEDLILAQHELQTLKDVCNHRELELCALETSLRKASDMVDNVNSNVDHEVHQVIAELVQEIACMKDRTEDCASCREQETRFVELSKQITVANEAVEVRTEQAKDTEEALRSAQTKIRETESDLVSACNLLAGIIDKRRQSRFVENGEGCTMLQQQTLPELVQLVASLLDESHDILETRSPISSQDYANETLQKDGEYTENSCHLENNQKPFAVTLNDMINQSTEVIQNALSEFNSECSLVDDGVIFRHLANNAEMVEFEVYESLRRKYDALQEEREELLNETFAVIDASAAANLAEIDVITRRIGNEADLRFNEFRRESDALIQFYDDRLASCTCSS